MFSRSISDLKANGEQGVFFDGSLLSFEILTKADKVGFSISDVHATTGFDEALWYKNHWEANVIVSGKGFLQETSTGKSWEVGAGDTYVVGTKDRHHFRILEDIHIVSIFSPALAGDEVYDEDGSLAPSGSAPVNPRTMFVKRDENTASAINSDNKTHAGTIVSDILGAKDAVDIALLGIKITAGGHYQITKPQLNQAFYVLNGNGSLSSSTNSDTYDLAPGVVLYSLSENRYQVLAKSDLQMIAIHNPEF
jgi:L-ectoine synthase